MSEKNTQQQIERRAATVRLSPSLYKSVELYAANHGKSVGQVLAEVTASWWQKQPDRAKYEKLQEAK